MGASILAVLGAIGTVLSAINGIYSFVKNADEFLSGRSDWDAVRAVISSQITIRNQILQVSGQILDAVAQLDRRIFLEHMADKLGDSDQAVLALDTWKRTGDLNQRAIALNESAGALSDVLRYSNNSVYPNESLAFPMVEILLKRVVVLKEADPQFALSALARQPVEDAVQFLRSTADSMSSAIEDANAIRDRSSIGTRVVTLPRSEGGGRMTVLVLHLDVSYRNLDGSVTVERRGDYEDTRSELEAMLTEARADATGARQRGLERDLERAHLDVLREAADAAERSLLVAEARWVSTTFLRREPTDLETAYFIARRRRADFEEVAVALAESMELSQDHLTTLMSDVSDRPLDKKAQDSLLTFTEEFGKGALVSLLLKRAEPTV